MSALFEEVDITRAAQASMARVAATIAGAPIEYLVVVEAETGAELAWHAGDERRVGADLSVADRELMRDQWLVHNHPSGRWGDAILPRASNNDLRATASVGARGLLLASGSNLYLLARPGASWGLNGTEAGRLLWHGLTVGENVTELVARAGGLIERRGTLAWVSLDDYASSVVVLGCRAVGSGA